MLGTTVVEPMAAMLVPLALVMPEVIIPAGVAPEPVLDEVAAIVAGAAAGVVTGRPFCPR